MTRLVLTPSPFVGAVSWRGVAQALPDAVALDYGVVAGPDWYGAVAEAAALQAGPGPWIAVMHSGAGGFAPAIAAAAGEGLVGLIYVDAILPHPGRSCLSTAPDDLVSHLRSLTTDGLLAPWNQWFGPDPTPRMIPDSATQAAFVEGLPRTPFAFLEAVAPDQGEWEQVPSAYLQISKNYEETATKAELRGWRVRRARMHHLAMASEPEAVAALLAELAAEIAG